MDIIRPGKKIDFMRFRKIAYTLSIILIVISMSSVFFLRGFNYGIDFVGGTIVQVMFEGHVSAKEIRAALEPIGMKGASIQNIEDSDKTEFLIRTPKTEDVEESISLKVKDALCDAFGSQRVDIRRVEMVGAEVSQELKQKGYLSLFYAGLGILIYIWWRFELKFSLGAILALVHDVVITVGIFSITGRELSLPVIAALLTIIGYSLNDTIVVFDRIRENLKNNSSEKILSQINNSVSQTLNRTILTSLTSFVVVWCLYIFGGEVIHNFAFAMMVGILVGTYSSIFVASPSLYTFTRQ
ncbi:MAG: protein translocase subunit SecF [Thermodesulfobacteriota bacterium]|nr:protein translocase subunit SecF [Thermodesulfobacteriota bacterium]